MYIDNLERNQANLGAMWCHVTLICVRPMLLPAGIGPCFFADFVERLRARALTKKRTVYAIDSRANISTATVDERCPPHTTLVTHRLPFAPCTRPRTRKQRGTHEDSRPSRSAFGQHQSPTFAMSTDKPLPFIYQFAAGAVAGVSEILVMYPLDVVKTRVQIQGKVPVPGQDHYTSMIDCFRKIIANEG